MPAQDRHVSSTKSRALLARIGGQLTGRDVAAARGSLWMWAHDPELLIGLDLAVDPRSYRRELIWRDGPMSAWLFLWAPESETPIHDHHCLCCYGVVRGSLTETTYAVAPGGGAVAGGRLVRDAGTTNALVPESPNIHRMVNESEALAVTMHLYGFCPDRHLNSVRETYLVAA